MNTIQTLEIGGEEYKLKLSLKASAAIEKKLGRSLQASIDDADDNPLEMLITVMWGAMQAFHPEISIEEVADLLEQYLDEGHSVEELMDEIKVMFETSPFFKKGQATKSRTRK